MTNTQMWLLAFQFFGLLVVFCALLIDGHSEEEVSLMFLLSGFLALIFTLPYLSMVAK
jgi:hypothetical protein